MVEDDEPGSLAEGNRRAIPEDDVRAAIDRQAVSELLVHYVHALDNRDWAALERCFTADAAFVHPGGRVQGPADIVSRGQAALQPLDGSQHLLGSISVTIDGDSAQATSYFHAQHVRVGVPGGDLYVIAGTYRDRLRRTADGWAIFERTQTYAWRSGNPDVIVRGNEAPG